MVLWKSRWGSGWLSRIGCVVCIDFRDGAFRIVIEWLRGVLLFRWW
jgi:hypothetical protein